MLIDRWHIERRFCRGRTEFTFQFGADLQEFHLVEATITRRLRGQVTRRICGPAGEEVLTVDLGDHLVKVVHDYEFVLYFFPSSEEDKELTQAFALQLENALRDEMAKTPNPEGESGESGREESEREEESGREGREDAAR